MHTVKGFGLEIAGVPVLQLIVESDSNQFHSLFKDFLVLGSATPFW